MTSTQQQRPRPRSGGVGKVFTAADAVTKSISLGTAVAIPLAIVFVVVIVFFVFFCCKKRRNKKKESSSLQGGDGDEAHASLTRTSTSDRNQRVRSDISSPADWESDSDEGDLEKGRGREAGMNGGREKMVEVSLSFGGRGGGRANGGYMVPGPGAPSPVTPGLQRY